MSATSISPVAAPAASTPRATAQHGTARWARARVEARRILAHPVCLLGAVASVALLALQGRQLAPLTLSGNAWYPAGIALLCVTCLAASRARRDGAQDIYSAGPLAARVRTQAALLSLAAPALVVAALTLVAAIVMAGTDGVLVFEDALRAASARACAGADHHRAHRGARRAGRKLDEASPSGGNRRARAPGAARAVAVVVRARRRRAERLPRR